MTEMLIKRFSTSNEAKLLLLGLFEYSISRNSLLELTYLLGKYDSQKFKPTDPK